MLLSNKIIIKWSERNKKYFEDKGYKYTGIGTLLEVYIKDLQHGSSINISIKCDYCGNIINKPYVRYINSVNNSVIKKDCCAKCQPLKNRETLMETHGVINVSQLKEVQEKTKKTNLERYGTQYILQNLEIREKEKRTNLKRYGVECVLQSKQIRKQIEQTNLKKYGCKCNLNNPEVKKRSLTKFKQTCLKKFGVDSPLKSREIRIKAYKTMYNNGTAPCTKPQKYIYELLNNIKECKLNYPVDTLWLDIAYPNEKIYIEYDGGGHDLSVKKGCPREKFQMKEIRRQYYLKNKGWKLIRIISKNDKLPNDEIIINLIKECKNYLLTTNHTWIKINLDEDKIKCKNYVKDIIY